MGQGVSSVLVKRGTNGSLLIDKDGFRSSQPIFKADKVKRPAARLTLPWITSYVDSRMLDINTYSASRVTLQC